MKKISILKYLAIVSIFLSASFGFAQTVTVPANCIVVSTNTALGGVLGPGGKVTSGGVVTMPDGVSPNGGTFTFTGPGGSILNPIISWALSGDLSSATTTPNYNSPVQPANGTTATIISYNKTIRPSENSSTAFPLNNPNWARSKGKVIVSYSIVNGTFSCGTFLSFEIFKTFTASPQTNIPVIVGPDCIEGGKQCTFSVDQIASDNANDAIGFDKYYWTGMPPSVNGSTYYSADNSSITFTPTTSGQFTIRCCIGRANPWDGGIALTQATSGTTCVTKNVGAAPSQPTFSVNPNGLCVPTGTVAVPNQVFTINYTSANTCTWTMANTGWTIGAQIPTSSTQTSGSVTINTNGFNNPGVLTLTVSNGTCTPLTFLYQINRTLTAPVAIAPTNTTLTSNCLTSNVSSNATTGLNIFAISSSANANITSWSVTLPNSTTAATGFSFTTQTPSSTVGLNVLATAAAGSYELKATTSCGGVLIYPFTVKPATVSIIAPLPPCVTRGGGAVTFTCGTSSGATGYLWSFPTGWTATSFTTTTNSISVTPTATAIEGDVKVTPLGAVATCNGNQSVAFKVNFNAVAPTGVTPSACMTSGSSSATLTVANAQNFGTYTVTSTPAGITGSVTGSGVIPLTIPSTLAAGNYALVVTHSNSSTVVPTYNCGSASLTTATLTLGANPYSIFTLTSAQSDTFFISGAPVGATYVWFVNNIQAATPPTPNQLVLTGNGAVPTSVYCNVTFSGCTTRMNASLAGVTHSQRSANNGITNGIKDITIYPNPNNGTFTINIDKVKESATATLYDFSGKKIKDFTLTKGENKIENEGLAKGTYIVVIYVDEKTDVKQIIIK